LHLLGSTYSADNHAVYDGISRPGTRIVSFAPVLKHGFVPLSPILAQLMGIGEAALGRPVEIEFAAQLPPDGSGEAKFGFLQLRPLVVAREGEEPCMEEADHSRLICQSTKVLGNGRIADCRDLLMISPASFERAQSREVAQIITRLNTKLVEEGKPYLLIGVGRWGSNDPWLGIPV